MHNDLSRRFSWLTFLFSTFLFISCEESSIENDINPDEYLLDYELLDTFEASQLRTLISLFDPDVNTEVILYDIDVYRVSYLTQYQGETTEASGLICMPAAARVVNFPFFLGFHASISSHAEAPSLFSNPLGTGLEFFGSLGYITLIPDYVGFGDATEFLHPYLVRESVTSVSTDMVKAAAEMMTTLEQTYVNELYMAGYSQGAYNAMAFLYALENENILPNWEIVATAAGGGTYVLSSLTADIINNDVYSSPELLAFLIWSYHTYYNLAGDAGQYFQEPYASLIPDLFDGNLTLGEIKSQLTPDLSQLLKKDFLDDFRNGDENTISNLLQENSVPAWAVDSPVNLLHTPDDEVLNISNSQKFLTQLENAGASNITFTPLVASSHRQAVIPMLVTTIFWMQNFQGA
jgi:pimeloyl-ACP methyl ester carboxylesterase